MIAWRIIGFYFFAISLPKGSYSCTTSGQCPHRKSIISTLRDRGSEVIYDVFLNGEFSVDFHYTPFKYYEAMLNIAMSGDVLKGTTKEFLTMHDAFVRNLRTRCNINVNSKLEKRITAAFETEYDSAVLMYEQAGGQIIACPNRPQIMLAIVEAMENGELNLSEFLINSTSGNEFEEFRETLSTFQEQIDAEEITDVKQVVEKFKKFDKDFREILLEKCYIPLMSKQRTIVVSKAMDVHREGFISRLTDSSLPNCQNRTSLVNEISSGVLSISFIEIVERTNDYLQKYQELSLSDIKSIFDVMEIVEIATLSILKDECYIEVSNFQMDTIDEFFFRTREQLVFNYLEAGGAHLTECPNRQAIMWIADYGVPPNHLIAGYTEFEDVAIQIKELVREGVNDLDEVVERLKRVQSAFYKVLSDVCFLDIPGYETDEYFDSLVDSICHP